MCTDLRPDMLKWKRTPFHKLADNNSSRTDSCLPGVAIARVFKCRSKENPVYHEEFVRDLRRSKQQLVSQNRRVEKVSLLSVHSHS